MDNEEFYEEILLRMSEILRRRFVLHPKMTAKETVNRIEEILREAKKDELQV